MKKLLVYSLAAMLALPVMGYESDSVVNRPDGTKTEVSEASSVSKKKKGKKKKRKHTYRPGARQN